MSGTEAVAAVAVACVPDVIISNILERVADLVSLFRCSLVCKEWRGLVADPAFLRHRGILPQQGQGGQSQSSASLLGIFVQRDRPLRGNSRPRKISKLFPIRAPAFVPAPGSVLGPQRRFLTSFVRDDGILDDATPLAARDGLLLVRVRRPHPSTANKSSSVVHVLRLCVCNLLTGRCDLLPALDFGEAFNDEGVLGYALLTAADDDHGAAHDPADGYSTLFQVLLVGRGHAEQLRLRRFSSAASGGGGWDALDCRQPNLGGVRAEPHGLCGPYACRVAAVARGTAHWLFGCDAPRFYTLDVSAGTGRVSMTALPVDAAGVHMPWWLCTIAEGRERRLALLWVLKSKSSNRLAIMKQRDGGGDGDQEVAAGLDMAQQVDVELGFGDEVLSPVCIGERSGTVLALYHSDPPRAYVLDLRSAAGSAATRVDGWIRSFNYMTAVPFEINWAMFFVSWLGVKL